MPSETKKCCHCLLTLPVSEFRRRGDGYQSRCKGCMPRQRGNPSPEHREYRKKWREANAEKVRLSRRKARVARYGLTLACYDAMVEAQGGRCALCGTTEPGGVSPDTWCIDHCHKTGAVRGLLCFDCNTGLGKFKDDPEVLARAIEYLVHGGQTTERYAK